MYMLFTFAFMNFLMSLCKFYKGVLDKGLVDLVADSVEIYFHTVGPREFTASTSVLLGHVYEEAPSKCPQTRLYLAMNQYTMEKTRAQVGGPSAAQLLGTSHTSGICKKPDLLNTIETNIRETKAKYLPVLILSLGESVARLELGVCTLRRASGGSGGMAGPDDPHPSDHHPSNHPPPHEPHHYDPHHSLVCQALAICGA